MKRVRLVDDGIAGGGGFTLRVVCLDKATKTRMRLILLGVEWVGGSRLGCCE